MKLEEEIVPWEPLVRVLTEVRRELGDRFLPTLVFRFDDFADAVFCRAQRIWPDEFPPSRLYELAIATLALAPAHGPVTTIQHHGAPAVWQLLRKTWSALNDEMPSKTAPSMELAVVCGCTYGTDGPPDRYGRPWEAAVDALVLLTADVIRESEPMPDEVAHGTAEHVVGHVVYGSCASSGRLGGTVREAAGRGTKLCPTGMRLESWHPPLKGFLRSLLAGESSANDPRHPTRPSGASVDLDHRRLVGASNDASPARITPDPRAGVMGFEEVDWETLRPAVRAALDLRITARSRSPESHLNCPLLPLISDDEFAVVVETAGNAVWAGGAVPSTAFPLAVAFSAVVLPNDWPAPAELAQAWQELQVLHGDAARRLQARISGGELPSGQLILSAAEITIAYGAGWRGSARPLQPCRVNPHATNALLAMVNMITTETYEAIINRWNIEEEAPRRGESSGQRNERYAGDAQLILERLTNRCYCGHHQRGCPALRAQRADHAPSALCSCCKTEHRLSSWDPAKDSLWSFLRTAVRGPARRGSRILPSLRMPPPAGAFRCSMLAYLLEEAGLIRFVNSEVWRCRCGDELFERECCRRCNTRAIEAEMDRVLKPDWIVSRRDEHRYQHVMRRACVPCGHLATWPELRADRSAQRCPRCGSDRLSQRPTQIWTRLPDGGHRP